MPRFISPEYAKKLLEQNGYKNVTGEWSTDDGKGNTMTLSIWKSNPGTGVSRQDKPQIIHAEMTDSTGSAKSALYQMIEPEAIEGKGTNYMGGLGI